MKRARLIKQEELMERKNAEAASPKPLLAPLTGEVVRKWVTERQTRSVSDPRSAFSALFAQSQSA